MKKILLIITLIILLSLTSVFSLSITTCKSGDLDWECELDKICNCTISGTCTDGNLLVYDNNITNPLCSPTISNSSANIDWNNCSNPSGEVNVRADCSEAQSEEETILLFGAITTTSTTIRTTTTIITTTTRLTTTTIQIPAKQVCPYECCINMPEYNSKYCPQGLMCCPDHTCKKSCEAGTSSRLILWIVLAAMIPIVLFLLYIWKGKSSENIAEF